MADVIRYLEPSDPTNPVPSDWPHHQSDELYAASSTPQNSTSSPGGAGHVRDLHTKLENLIKVSVCEIIEDLNCILELKVTVQLCPCTLFILLCNHAVEREILCNER